MGERGGEGVELLAICVREPQLTGVFRHNGVCNDYYNLLSLKRTGTDPRFVNRG